MSPWRSAWFPVLGVSCGLAVWLAIWTLQPEAPMSERSEAPRPPEAKAFPGLISNSSQLGPNRSTETDAQSVVLAPSSQSGRGEPETVAGSVKKKNVSRENPTTDSDGGAPSPSWQTTPVTSKGPVAPATGNLESVVPVPATDNPELVIPVPRGARVPAIFYDETPRPAPQQRMLDRIAQEFNDAVNQAAAGGGNPASEADLAEIWRAAAERADQQYINLYGFAAWHELHLRGAIEALQERKAVAPR
jgi:hypothetical protein